METNRKDLNAKIGKVYRAYGWTKSYDKDFVTVGFPMGYETHIMEQRERELNKQK